MGAFLWYFMNMYRVEINQFADLVVGKITISLSHLLNYVDKSYIKV